MIEEWRFIPGSSVAQVSSLGRLRELRKGRWFEVPARLNPRTNYLQASVRFDAPVGRRTKPVHRLVGEAFLGPRPADLETRHLNSDRFDNRADNLRYGTHSENMRDQVLAGSHREARKVECINGHSLETARVNALGHRTCRECARLNVAGWNARRRQARIDAGWDPIDYHQNRTGYWERVGKRHPAIKDVCGRGHDLVGANLRITSPGGKRVCRACERDNAAAYRARRAERAA